MPLYFGMPNIFTLVIDQLVGKYVAVVPIKPVNVQKNMDGLLTYILLMVSITILITTFFDFETKYF